MPAIERLLIRAPNWLGDCVLSLGAVRDVRRNFPSARITVMARPAVLDFYRTAAAVDDVRASGGVWSDASALRGSFDAAVLLPNSFGSALAVHLAGVPERWGYGTDGRSLLLTRAARVPRAVEGESQVYYYRAMLAGVGLAVSASPDVSLDCPAEWSERGAELLGDGGWIGISPGASFGSAKRWLPARYAATADFLARRLGTGVAILGTASDRPLAEAIAGAMGVTPRVLCGETTLSELVGVLSRLRLLVTNDSGPMHVASALGVPVVAVFGPTDWRETAPVGDRHRLVREPVHCSPCLLRECPIDHRCMRRIDADRVAAAALELLAGAAALNAAPDDGGGQAASQPAGGGG